MIAHRYQVWQDRKTGLYYGVRGEAGGQVSGITEGLPTPPRALSLPMLQYHPPPERPPKLSNPRWRLVRLFYG